jgi:hypothetical protein
LKQLLSMREADPAPTPPLHVTLRLPRTPTYSSGAPNNGVDSRGRLAAVAGAPGAASGEPLIIIGSTVHVSHVECELTRQRPALLS